MNKENKLELSLEDIKVLIINKTNYLINGIYSLSKKDIVSCLYCFRELVKRY